MLIPWATNEQLLVSISDNRERIAEAVGRALDERGWLPDQIVVLMLSRADPLGAALMSRWGIDPAGGEPTVVTEPVETVRELCDELGLSHQGLERTPEHGCVRVLFANSSAPVLAHAQYVTAANYGRWQRRLDVVIERALESIARRGKPTGSPS